MLTSDMGDDVLKKVTTYEWDDDGEPPGPIHADRLEMGRRFTDNAGRSGNRRVPHGEPQLSGRLDSGFLGLSKVPAAQLSPLLMRSYATALAPHIGELVGGHRAPSTPSGRRWRTIRWRCEILVSVFVADPEAGRTAVEATHSAAEQYEIDAAAAPPDSDESVADLRAAGSLLGAAYGAVKLAGSDIPTPPVGEATNDVAVRVAATSFQRTRTPRRSASTYRMAG